MFSRVVQAGDRANPNYTMASKTALEKKVKKNTSLALLFTP
jgi:hypothetical protein